MTANRRAGSARNRDETGSIIIAVLFMFIAAAISVTMLGTVLAQASMSRVVAERVRTLHAAQAGVDVALGQLRAANDGSGNGVWSALPCGPLSGQVEVGGTVGYSVTISYYTQNPTGQSASWLTSNVLSCQGSGPSALPAYAYLASAGTDIVGGRATPSFEDRTVKTLYVFQLTNANIAGGEIAVYNDGNPSHIALCFDAGSSAPASGTVLQVKACSNPATASQLFAYQSDLSLVLASTEGTSSPMCLDAAYNRSGQHTSGTTVVFKPCTGVEANATVTPEQQFSYNDTGAYETATDYSSPSSADVDNYCLTTQSYNFAGSQVVLKSGSQSNSYQSFDACGGPFNGSSTWIPATSVGAGDADTSPGTVGATPEQIVNYAQFGRCIDLTNASTTDNGPPSQTSSGNGGFFILYPCKQNPNPANVAWNQKLAISPSGQTNELVMTAGSGTAYCLISPLTSTGAELTIITMQPPYPNSTTNGACSSGSVSTTTNKEYYWNYTGNTGDYTTSYQFRDANGNCLDVGPQQTPPGSLSLWSTLVVDPCSSSLTEKWQAPPNLVPSQLANTHEP